MVYVHHPRGRTTTERVGARTVEFVDGVAEVVPVDVVVHYRRAGYVVTDERGVDAAAPAGNASAEEWRAYARTVETDPDRLAGLDGVGRDELRELYGQPVTDPVDRGVLDH